VRDRVRDVTVQAILSAAETVFYEEGLHAAHMNDIAARAGVAVGTLYNYFKDREALLASLLEARREELLGRIDEALAASQGVTFRERLKVLMAAILAHAQAHRQFLHILWQGEIGRYQQMFPSTCQIPNDTLSEIYRRIGKVMQQGVKEKILKPDLADLAPMLFLGMVKAVAMRGILREEASDFLGEGDRLLSFFLDGAAR
jgi:AcrR family transcriptional regulator